MRRGPEQPRTNPAGPAGIPWHIGVCGGQPHRLDSQGPPGLEAASGRGRVAGERPTSAGLGGLRPVQPAPVPDLPRGVRVAPLPQRVRRWRPRSPHQRPPPMRRSIFGLEAMALLDLRPSRVVVEGSEGMVFLDLVLEEQSLDPDEEPVEGARWALVGASGSWTTWGPGSVGRPQTLEAAALGPILEVQASHRSSRRTHRCPKVLAPIPHLRSTQARRIPCLVPTEGRRSARSSRTRSPARWAS